MKTTKETLKILGISRNTLKKRAKELNITPYRDEYGWLHYNESDIQLLKGYSNVTYKPTPPFLTTKERNESIKRDMVTVGTLRVDITHMTEDDREEIKRLASLYETQGIATKSRTFNKVKSIIANYVD